MKMYWSANSVPELKGLDPATQKNLYKQAVQYGLKSLGKRFVWTRLTIIFAAFIPFMFFFGHLFSGILGGAIMGGILGFVVALLIQSPIVDKGREWLREQGYPKS